MHRRGGARVRRAARRRLLPHDLLAGRRHAGAAVVRRVLLLLPRLRRRRAGGRAPRGRLRRVPRRRAAAVVERRRPRAPRARRQPLQFDDGAAAHRRRFLALRRPHALGGAPRAAAEDLGDAAVGVARVRAAVRRGARRGERHARPRRREVPRPLQLSPRLRRQCAGVARGQGEQRDRAAQPRQGAVAARVEGRVRPAAAHAQRLGRRRHRDGTVRAALVGHGRERPPHAQRRRDQTPRLEPPHAVARHGGGAHRRAARCRSRAPPQGGHQLRSRRPLPAGPAVARSPRRMGNRDVGGDARARRGASRNSGAILCAIL